MSYCIKYIDLPSSIRGVTVKNCNFYVLYINTKLSYIEKQQVIKQRLAELKSITKEVITWKN